MKIVIDIRQVKEGNKTRLQVLYADLDQATGTVWPHPDHIDWEDVSISKDSGDSD